MKATITINDIQIFHYSDPESLTCPENQAKIKDALNGTPIGSLVIDVMSMNATETT